MQDMLLGFGMGDAASFSFLSFTPPFPLSLSALALSIYLSRPPPFRYLALLYVVGTYSQRTYGAQACIFVYVINQV